MRGRQHHWSYRKWNDGSKFSYPSPYKFEDKVQVMASSTNTFNVFHVLCLFIYHSAYALASRRLKRHSWIQGGDLAVRSSYTFIFYKFKIKISYNIIIKLFLIVIINYNYNIKLDLNV